MVRTGHTGRLGSEARCSVIAFGVAAAMLLAFQVSTASAQMRSSYSSGQNVAPAFEGWEENADGSFSFVFGYMNRNWEEELNVPAGAENSFSPGPADRGQPTHFLPRRNRFVFKVRVPADFGNQELVWTLTTNGVTEKAYATLNRDYRIDPVVIMSETGALGAGSSNEEVRGNVPPTIVVEGERTRRVRVGETLSLAALVTDDGLPPSRGVAAPPANATPEQLLTRALRPNVRVTVNKAVRLHYAWFVYRGAGEVTFDPPQVKTWEDTRPWANSPWAPFWRPPGIPADGRWVTSVTFHQPGTYVLRGRADDGGLYADQEITVVVEPLRPDE
jgi:hypothetical protein